MRTNINLDEDVHRFAQLYAGAKGLTMSGAVNALVRKAEAASQPAAKLERSESGLAMFPRRGGVVTTELVRKIESETV